MDNVYKLIGIDPGSKTTGISIIYINDDNDILSMETFLLNTNHIETTYRKAYDIVYSLHSIRNGLLDILDSNTIGVSIENPFIYARRPTSVIPLGKVLGVIEETIISVDELIHIRKISPSEVKKSIGVHGNSGDKELIRLALLEHPMAGKYLDINSITEHEHDATAIVLELYSHYINSPYLFL